jgi:hypothetical protein
MNTISGHPVTIRMLLWEADSREENGKRPEATKIRQWVADLLSEQSKADAIRLIASCNRDETLDQPTQRLARARA